MARGDGHGLGDSLGGVGANLLGDLTAVGLDAHVAKKIRITINSKLVLSSSFYKKCAE